MRNHKTTDQFSTPAKFCFPLHHPRSRFKNNVEDVLGYVSFGIVEIGELPRRDFNALLDKHIRGYGSNANASCKAIQNWRTEISALFGMVIQGPVSSRPAAQTKDLAFSSNLPRFFAGVMSSFQYPAGFHKPLEVVKMVKAGIKFHPVRWLAEYFTTIPQAFITKEEFCHCVMNDLRVTRDGERVKDTALRISNNRALKVSYVSQGDVVRYAGDILDYLFYALLLDKDSSGRYTLRGGASKIFKVILAKKCFFDKYDIKNVDCKKVGSLQYEWATHRETVYSKIIEEIDRLDINATEPKKKDANSSEKLDISSTASIGRAGENYALQHEIIRVTNEGRKDLTHLIKLIPTHLAYGYDIKSIEADTEEDRYIEVKTCVSRNRVNFNNFHLTPNEWRVADCQGDRYFVYRIAIDDEGVQLFIIQNPVQKFREKLVRLSFHHDVQLTFKDEAGTTTKLLCANTK